MGCFDSSLTSGGGVAAWLTEGHIEGSIASADRAVSALDDVTSRAASALATGTAAGDASIWTIPSGDRAHHLRELGEAITAVAFSPDGRLIAAGALQRHARALGLELE